MTSFDLAFLQKLFRLFDIFYILFLKTQNALYSYRRRLFEDQFGEPAFKNTEVFVIRRKIGSDKLHKALLSEYVKQLL